MDFKYPSLRLDQSTAESSQLSPFAHIVLQAQIGQCIAPLIGGARVKSDLSPDQVLTALNEVRILVDELPPIFRVDNPDFTLDDQHPYYVFQRHQLHVVIHMAMLGLLKPYLTHDPEDFKSLEKSELRKTAVETALKLLEIAELLFNHEFPINAKFHMVVFCIFDTATILCSAMIHDVDNLLPHRARVMNAVGNSLDLLQQLSLFTKLGASSYWFLYKLVQASPGLLQHVPITKRQRTIQRLNPSASEYQLRNQPSGQTLPTTKVSIIESEVKSLDTAFEATSLPEIPIANGLDFDLDHFLAQNPLGSSSEFDLGGMEHIFAWDDLNLDFSSLSNDANCSGMQ